MTAPVYLPLLDVGRPYLPEHLAFWAHCRQSELRFQHCGECATVRHPPAPCCPRCGSMAVDWVLAPARAELFSYTVVHHASAPELRAHVPYNIAIVRFPDLPGVKIVSNVIDAPPGSLRIGMPLMLVWETYPDGTVLPRFRRAP